MAEKVKKETAAKKPASKKAEAAPIELSVVGATGKQVKTVAVSSGVFGAKVAKSLLHQAVRSHRAALRQGTHSVLTRAEMTGGGRKPWKQKGTGNARAGSNTSSIWVGGGVAHGPKPRKYDFKINKQERRLALCGAISERNKEGRLTVVESFDLSQPKTKLAWAALARLGVKKGEKALIVLRADDVTTGRSLRNIDGVKVIEPSGINVYDVMNARHLIITGDALGQIEQRLA